MIKTNLPLFNFKITSVINASFFIHKKTRITKLIKPENKMATHTALALK